jgi:tetratricopeptide (TPR) repeat protein
MNEIAIGAMSMLLSLNTPVGEAVQKYAETQAAYYALLEKDQAALDEVNNWLDQNEAFRREGGGVSKELLAARIANRMSELQEEYVQFLQKYPGHVEGRIAYGSFLNEVSEEEQAAKEWDKARLLDPNHPASWNNLANHFGHFGPVAKAFPYYEKAIELRPNEPVYHQNLATTVYLFRRDAEKYYDFTEQQVFDHALKLYRTALELSGGDFAVANDLAQTYYGIEPFRYEEALETWQEVLKLATNEVEQQNVFIHLARIEIKGKAFDEARNYLQRVSLPQYAALRERLEKKLERDLAAAAAATDSEKEADGSSSTELDSDHPPN